MGDIIKGTFPEQQGEEECTIYDFTGAYLRIAQLFGTLAQEFAMIAAGIEEYMKLAEQEKRDGKK